MINDAQNPMILSVPCGGEIQISDYRYHRHWFPVLRKQWKKGDNVSQARTKNKTNEFLISSLSIIETPSKNLSF